MKIQETKSRNIWRRLSLLFLKVGNLFNKKTTTPKQIEEDREAIIAEGIKSLWTRGYVVIPSTPEIEKVVDQLDRLTAQWFAQPLEHKLQYVFSEQTGGYEPPRPKDDASSNDTHKETFTIVNTYDWLEFIENKAAHKIKQSQLDFDLMVAIYHYIDLMEERVSIFAKIIARASDMPEVYDEIMNNYYRTSYRALGYSATKEFILNNGHNDRGTGTAISRESVQGHQNSFTTKDRAAGTWRDIKFERGKIVMFPGLVCQKITKCRIKSLPHRVVTTPESQEKGRDSGALFLDTSFTTKKLEKGSGSKIFPHFSNFNFDPDNPEHVAEFDTYFEQQKF